MKDFKEIEKRTRQAFLSDEDITPSPTLRAGLYQKIDQEKDQMSFWQQVWFGPLAASVAICIFAFTFLLQPEQANVPKDTADLGLVAELDMFENYDLITDLDVLEGLEDI